MTAPRSLPRRWWLFAFLWWTLNGVASASQYVQMIGPSGERVTWRHALGTSLASAWLWVPLTMLALWLAHRYPLGRGRLVPRIGLHLLAGMAVVIFFRAGAHALEQGRLRLDPERGRRRGLGRSPAR